MAERAEFHERSSCIACGSGDLRTLDRGVFGSDPHRSRLTSGHWGESPLPYLETCEWELVECGQCSQVFHKRVLTPEWEQRRHDQWMTKEAIASFEAGRGLHRPQVRFDRCRGDVQHLLIAERMTRHLRARDEPLRLLDFGCGWGRLVTLASMFGFDASGIDRSTSRRDGHPRDAGRIYSSLQEFAKDDQRPVHAVFMKQVLEHLQEPADVLRSIHGLMAPSGVLLVEVPDAGHVRGLRTEADLVVDGLDHLNAFGPESLTNIVERAGFALATPCIAHVTSETRKVVKREVRRVLRHLLGRTTQQLFRRV